MAKKAKGRGSHLLVPVKISTKLSQVIGKGPMPRSMVMKKIWAYIKRKNLQHPKKRQFIILDDKLKTIFKPAGGGPANTIIMFQMTKQLSKHIESSKVKVKGNPSRYEEEDEDDEYETRSNPGYDDDEDEDEYDTYSNPYEDDDEEEEEETYIRRKSNPKTRKKRKNPSRSLFGVDLDDLDRTMSGDYDEEDDD